MSGVEGTEEEQVFAAFGDVGGFLAGEMNVDHQMGRDFAALVYFHFFHFEAPETFPGDHHSGVLLHPGQRYDLRLSNNV
jgi:hypothetical protein